MGRRWIVAALVAAMGWPMFPIDRAEASQVDGTWMIQDLILNLFECQNQVCGRIVWIKDPKRRPSQCSQTIVWGLAPSGPSEWSGGSIIDPDNAKTYHLSATLEPDGHIDARIYLGVPLLGQTKILKRVDVNAYTGRC
jgi:uncharacterized protein (DUF2147 family)